MGNKKLVLLLFSLSSIGFLIGYFLGINQERNTNFHYSFFSQKEIFEDNFKQIDNSRTKNKKNIKSLVVPHHFLASRLIAKAFDAISSEKPDIIILMSPNHFLTGDGKIISSIYNWKTPYGVLSSEKNLIRKLQRYGFITIEEGPFQKEHGISILVAFIKKIFPNSKFMPLIFRDTVTKKECDELVYFLYKNCPNALIIASLDFAHHVSSEKADIEDQKSFKVIKKFNYKKIDSLNIDSRPIFRTLLKYLELEKAKNFNLVAHSNSAKVLKNKHIPEVTSYILGYFYSNN